MGVMVSDDVPVRCREAIYEAVSIFQRRGVHYLYIQDVPHDAAAVSGLIYPSVISVVAGPPTDPNSDGWTELVALDGRMIWAEIRLRDCSVRCATHELGHALGLDHETPRENLMYPFNIPEAVEITPAQIEQVL